MNYLRLCGLLTFLVSVCILTSCSGGRNPVELKSPEQSSIPDSLGVVESGDTSNRSVLAVYDAVIDPEAKTFTIMPLERIVNNHFPLTLYFSNILRAVDYGWSPHLWADIKLSHPFPGSGIDGFDPRVIAILPARAGVSFNYPIFNCIGNNSVVMEPDGYTKLFDSIGSGIPGNTNPFKAYFKDQPYRVWSSTGVTSETQRWNLNLMGFGGPVQFKLVVDISTNYPSIGQPIVDNAKEPVEITAFVGPGIDTEISWSNIEIALLDWQGSSDLKCSIESPQLFDYTIQLSYSYPGENLNEYVFTGKIPNNREAPAGEYGFLINAWDSVTNIHIYKEILITLEEPREFNPEDITAPWLEFGPYGIFIDNDIAYVGSDENYIYVLDISDPINPEGIAYFEIPHVCTDIFVANGYAYITNAGYENLYIYDIDPLESAYLVSSIGLDNYSFDVIVSDGYAYVSVSFLGLRIIDVDPPDSPQIVNTVPMDYSGAGNNQCAIHKGYAYFVDGNSGLKVIDINPPELASVVKTIDTQGFAYEVNVDSGYAYITKISEGIMIIDIDPLETAHIVKSIDTYANSIKVLNGFAFVAKVTVQGDSFKIIDIDPPESAEVVQEIPIHGTIRGIDAKDGFAFVPTSYGGGFITIDTEPPETAYIANVLPTRPRNIYSLTIENGYLFSSDSDFGFQILDVSSPDSAYIKDFVNGTSLAKEVFLYNGYAYLATYNAGLEIVDIDPIDSATLINTVDLPGLTDVYVKDGYAYAVSYNSGRSYMIDVEPPSSAHVIKSMYLGNNLQTLDIFGNFAYVAGGSTLYVIDITTLDTAPIVKTIETTGSEAFDIVVSGGYVYLSDYDSGLFIIDIKPLEYAHVEEHYSLASDWRGIQVVDGYLYAARVNRGLDVIDVTPPDNAHEVAIFNTEGWVNDVYVQDNYAYLGDDENGWHIIKLW